MATLVAMSDVRLSNVKQYALSDKSVPHLAIVNYHADANRAPRMANDGSTWLRIRLAVTTRCFQISRSAESLVVSRF